MDERITTAGCVAQGVGPALLGFSVVGDRGESNAPQEWRRPVLITPSLLDQGEERCKILLRPAPWVLRWRERARLAGPQEETGGPFRIGSREHRADRAAIDPLSIDRGSSAPGGIQHGADVIHLRLEIARLGHPVRQSDPPLVHADHACEQGEGAEPWTNVRVLPEELKVRDPVEGHQQIRSITEDLVRDERSICASGVAGLGGPHLPSLRPAAWSRKGRSPRGR